MVFQDTGAAIIFLFEEWAWGEGAEFRKASEACYRSMEMESAACHEVARQAVADALVSAGIKIR
ncbi:DUF982 domain-containing protein [Falsirhodobacter deserti]|uniref:DUF982 domain-containing protein n=1 Tax=Falsirhodobacter deserti TaxID=1365611 RepID=UPI000FE2FFAC